MTPTVRVGLGLFAAFALAAPAFAEYKPTLYHPKSKHDFTGLWERKGGIAWDPTVVGPTLSAPLTPEYKAIFDQRLKDAAEGKPTGDITASCLPPGMPRVMTMTYPMEIMQNETQLNIFAEWDEQTRRIFVDGRPHPSPDDLDQTFNGHSIGHWEGDVLVADTVGLRGDTDLEASGLPHSDALRIAERIWLADDNTLKDQITLTDPKAFTHPYTVTKTYVRMKPDKGLLPYVCEENNRNPIGQNGVIGFVHENNGKAIAP